MVVFLCGPYIFAGECVKVSLSYFLEYLVIDLLIDTQVTRLGSKVLRAPVKHL